jgi:hypothetical protein
MDDIRNVLILAAAIVLAGILSGGFYSISAGQAGVNVVNRFTGTVWHCFGRCEKYSE